MHADPQIVTVSQVNDYLRLLVESDAFLSNLWVQGEVSNVYLSKPGHLYFTLSDGASSIKAVAFRNSAMRIQHAVTNGAELIVGGRASVYAKDSTVQIYVDFADATGLGVQALELARLRIQLEGDGLFDPLRKRPLPPFPTRIAVVTSPTGAVIHDIQTVLRRRFPLAILAIAPAQVQGSGAVDTLLTALDLVLATGGADLVIIARGGGSAEDLSAFNDERLARAVFAYPIPVISAIGHETDHSILDDVADLRAPTPTAAAELATPDVADLAFELIDRRDLMGRLLRTRIDTHSRLLEQLTQRLDRSSPHAVLQRHNDRLALDVARMRVAAIGRVRTGQSEQRLVTLRLASAGLRLIERQRGELSVEAHRLRSLARQQTWVRRSALDVAQARLGERNPFVLLERGYSVLLGPGDKVIRSISNVAPGDKLRARVQDGTITGTVSETLPGDTTRNRV